MTRVPEENKVFAPLQRPDDLPDQEYQVAHREARAALYAEVMRLPERWAVIVALHLGLGDEDPHTFEEIAAKLGVVRQVPHKIFTKSMARLRHPDVIARLKEVGAPDLFGVRV